MTNSECSMVKQPRLQVGRGMVSKKNKLIKISFFRFRGFDNFVIHPILTKLQHYHHYNVKFYLHVGLPIIGLMYLQKGDDIIVLVRLEFHQNLVDDGVVKSLIP